MAQIIRDFRRFFHYRDAMHCVSTGILFFCISVILISCTSGNVSEYTRCEEACEYARRDCIEACGGYNTFGFSYDFGRSEMSSPYACSEKCEARAKKCFDLCKEKSD